MPSMTVLISELKVSESNDATEFSELLQHEQEMATTTHLATCQQCCLAHQELVAAASPPPLPRKSGRRPNNVSNNEKFGQGDINDYNEKSINSFNGDEMKNFNKESINSFGSSDQMKKFNEEESKNGSRENDNTVIIANKEVGPENDLLFSDKKLNIGCAQNSTITATVMSTVVMEDQGVDDIDCVIDSQPSRSGSVSRGMQVALAECELCRCEMLEELRSASPETLVTSEEKMEYLAELEPCPYYFKCCLDSIITLFCVTLLG